jgi:hypothetical protein
MQAEPIRILGKGGKGYEFAGKPSDLEAFKYMREIVFDARPHC